MELRTFIKTALLDIVGAVEDAQAETETGTVVPGGIVLDYKSVEHGVSEIQIVDFEVSVNVDESKGSEGKIGVVSSIIGASMAGRSSTESGQSSRLRFRIPIKLPTSGSISQ